MPAMANTAESHRLRRHDQATSSASSTASGSSAPTSSGSRTTWSPSAASSGSTAPWSTPAPSRPSSTPPELGRDASGSGRGRAPDRALWQRRRHARPSPTWRRAGASTRYRRPCSTRPSGPVSASSPSSVSTLPLYAYRDGDRDPLPDLPPLLRQPSADHEPARLAVRPCMASLLLRGNCYGRSSTGPAPGSCPPRSSCSHPTGSASDRPTARRVIRVDGQEVDPASIWHVRAFTVRPATWSACPPIAHARQAIGLGLAAETFGAQFFGDGAIPSGLLTTDQRITTEQAHDLKERWQPATGAAATSPCSATAPGSRPSPSARREPVPGDDPRPTSPPSPATSASSPS